MNEVEKLKGLLTFVQQIANQKGNEWMWDDIYELIDEKSNLSIIDNHPKLKHIYEQNILKSPIITLIYSTRTSRLNRFYHSSKVIL